MFKKFKNDDKGYLQWIRANPDGFVVNIDDPHNPKNPWKYPMVHLARHKSISGGSNYTTGDYIKICSVSLEELEEWSQTTHGQQLTRCGICAKKMAKPENVSMPSLTSKALIDLKTKPPTNLWLQAEDQVQAEALIQPPVDNAYDARVSIVRAITERRGQQAFRQELLKAYGGCCAITGCDVPEVLEAAHIVPYRGEHTNRVDNGILLRADWHILFDCGLFWITPEYVIEMAASLQNTCFSEWNGKSLHLPAIKKYHPNPEHLKHHADSVRERMELAYKIGVSIANSNKNA